MNITYDYKNKKVYKIPHNAGYILVRLWYDVENNKEFYYDGLNYQRHDENTYTQPIGWTWSDPKQFYNDFLNEPKHINLPIEFVSTNDVKKLKSKKFYNKNNKVYYVDNQGYFYIGCKHDMLDKKQYDKFKNEKDAIFVRYGVPCSGKEICKWFHSERDFKIEYQAYVKNLSRACGMIEYKILKYGYKVKSPNDYRWLVRLPYFDLYKENEIERKCCYNINSIANVLARKWCGLLARYKLFGDPFNNEDSLTDLIKKWIKYNNEQNMKEG